MKRTLIIGNGFDIGAGLKTSCSSFAAMNLGFKRYYKRSQKEQNEMKWRLQTMGYTFQKHCIDSRFLTYQQMMQFPISGCQAPDGYDSPYNFSESNSLSSYDSESNEWKINTM